VNARRVAAAAQVICESQKRKNTAAGIAADLESACLLQSAESAAEARQLRDDVTGACLARYEEEQENERLRARVDEVERAYTFDTAALKKRVAELEAERHSTNEALSDAAEALRTSRDRIAELETSLGVAAEQRHLMDPLDHSFEALAPRTVKSAFGLANDHIRGGCAHCRPSMRLPEMCPEGQRLSLAACKSINPIAGSAL
jgi:predicted nuclease with TOPRIM domain